MKTSHVIAWVLAGLFAFAAGYVGYGVYKAKRGQDSANAPIPQYPSVR